MATLNGTNYKKQYVDVPSTKIPVGEQAGRVRCAYDDYNLATSGVALANGDTILLMKLPAGARVVEVLLDSPDVGGTSLIELGWAANGVDLVDADGFITSLDISGAAAMQRLNNPAGALKQFTVETQVYATITNAGAAVAGILQFAVLYVVE